MDPLTIISALATFAPAILKHFGAGASAVSIAEKAGDIAKTVTGSENVGDAIEKLKASNELAVQYNLAILSQDTEFETLYISDKSSARLRDVEISKVIGANNRANWLVAFAVLTVTGILWYIAVHPITDEFAKNTMLVILGMYLGELKNIYAFEFGTTRRSADKDETISKLTDKV